MSLLTAYNGLVVRIGLYLLIFWPTVGYYVSHDAQRRGLSHPRRRGVVLGFLGIVGVVIHLSLVQREA